MTNIIDNWQSATGEWVKERPVGTVPPVRPAAQPLRVQYRLTGRDLVLLGQLAKIPPPGTTPDSNELAVETIPQIARLRSHPGHDEVLVALAAGQIPTDVTASAEALAHGLGAWRVTTRPAGPGCLWVLVLWVDPLNRSIHPTDIPSGSSNDCGDGADGMTGRGVLDRLASVRVGVTETGRAWILTLLPGRHLLVSGTTGSGKQGPW